MSSKTRFLSIGSMVALLVAVLVGWRVTSTAHADRVTRQPAPLTVATELATVKSMPIQILAVGQVESKHTVNIQPQITGVLKEVYFTEGQHVHKGQPLFLIDPAPFEAALTAAKAAYLTAKAQADREKPLAAKDYVSPQEYELTVASLTQAKAKLDQAQIDVSYTKIVSPIDGLTGNLVVKSGNVVSPGAATPLVTINQMQPILVHYNLAQQFLPEIRSYDAKHSVRIFITGEDGTGKLGQGKLVFIDNTVNTATGTVLFKAEVPNEDTRLWPGQYVGVDTQLAVEANAVTIPSSAVQSGQDGNFVYEVVDGKAAVKDITVDRVMGDVAVVAKGLRGGERVVTQVPRSLRPGSAVSLGTARPAAPDATLAAPVGSP